MADYNLAVDKARTTADPGEVTKYLHDLEDQNRYQVSDVNYQMLCTSEKLRKRLQKVETEKRLRQAPTNRKVLQ